MIRKRLAAADRLLEKAYGTPKRRRRADPIGSLIGTILSQNTNDRNSHRAYEAMRKAFPAWEDVMNAPRAKLEKALKPGGLARTKSGRIQRILRAIAKDGNLNLDGLRRLSTDEAEKRLLSFEGVGYKTARCVLLFALGRDVFPIDTHILRVLKRLGIIPETMTVDKAHQYVPQFVREDRSYPLHLNLIAHGRQVCHPRKPACATCALRRPCSYPASEKKPSHASGPP